MSSQTRATMRAASSELPPMSNTDSTTLIFSSPSTRRRSSASVASASVAGATNSTADTRTGAGSARRSSFAVHIERKLIEYRDHVRHHVLNLARDNTFDIRGDQFTGRRACGDIADELIGETVARMYGPPPR